MPGTPRTFRSHTVYTRAKWGDEWTQQTAVFADMVKFTCSPEIARADLSYRYGKVIPYGQTSFVTRAKLDVLEHYVKIVITQTDGTTLKWYGIIIDVTREQAGDGFNDPDSPVNSRPESGIQKFVAVGLEYLLEREIYNHSYARLKSSGTFESKIFRGIAFNMGGSEAKSRHLVGNMEAIGEKGSAVFAFSLGGSTQEWDGEHIIDYLLTYHCPKDKDGNAKVKFKADLSLKDAKLLQAIKPKLDCHGESVKTIIDAICDRRRAVSWYLSVDETTSPASVNLKIFTFNNLDIVLPDGGVTIPANADATVLDLANDPRVIGNPLRSDATTKYHRVIARGAPATYTLSLQATPEEGQGTLIRDWTDAQKTLYNAGASSAGSYAGLDGPAKSVAHARYRASHAMERVYRYFRWDADKIYDEIPSSVKINDDWARLWPPGARFLQHVPIKIDIDYTTPSTTLVSLKPADSVDEYFRPFGVIKDSSKYYHLHKLNAGESARAITTRHWSASLRMRHDQAGVAVDVSGAGQECIARDEFTAADSDDVSESRLESLRWQDMILTVAVELDNWAESQWPEKSVPLDTEDDCIKELVIEVPERRMDYVAKNTVFDIDDAGLLKKTSAGGFIADDSQKLKWIATIAWCWFQVERRALEYSFRSLDCSYHVGQLVTSLITTNADAVDDRTAEEINSVITSISFDMRAGSYTLETSFANLDSRSLVL